MKIDFVGIKLVREKTVNYEKKSIISSVEEAIEIVANEIKDMDREMLMSVNLTTKGEIINAHVVSIGSIDRSIFDPASIMKSALLSNAKSILLFHNHPSGNAYPSYEDIASTDMLKEACKLFNIDLLDHIILGDENCYSISAKDFYDYPSVLKFNEGSELREYVKENKEKTL